MTGSWSFDSEARAIAAARGKPETLDVWLNSPERGGPPPPKSTQPVKPE